MIEISDDETPTRQTGAAGASLLHSSYELSRTFSPQEVKILEAEVASQQRKIEANVGLLKKSKNLPDSGSKLK